MLDLGTLQYFPDLGISVFKDDDQDKPNHWYVIPDKPTWHTRKDPADSSKLIADFSYVKLTRSGQVDDGDQFDRAFFSFTTQLAASQEFLDKLKKARPELANATFLSPWFTATKADINIYAKPRSATDPQTFVKSVSQLLSPQRFGPALCPFQGELSKYGSPVMEALITDAEDSGLQIGYEVKQLVRLPASRITARIEAQMLLDATTDWASGKSRGIWGESSSEGKGKEGESGGMSDSFNAKIRQHLAPSIDVAWVKTPGASTESDVRKTVESWIFTLLQEQLQKIPGVSELMETLKGKRPDDPGTEDALKRLQKKIDIAGQNGPLFQQTYTSREAVEYTWNASGSLPGLGKLIPAIRANDDERKRYFLEILANDRFFAQRPVTISFTDNITSLTNAKIEGTLRMPEIPGGRTVEWEKQEVSEDFKFQAPAYSPVRVKMPLRKGADAKYRKMTLDVYLTGTASGKHVSLRHEQTLTDDRVDLTFAGLGLQQRTIDPVFLTFGTGNKDLRQVTVQCRYRTPEDEVIWNSSFDFKAVGQATTAAAQSFNFIVKQESVGGELEYRVEYFYRDGKSYPDSAKRQWRAFENDTLLLQPYFVNETIEVTARDFKAGSKDQLMVTLVCQSGSFSDKTTIYLGAAAADKKKPVTLRTIVDENVKLLVSATLIRDAGGEQLLRKDEEFALGPVSVSVQPTFPVSLDLSLIKDAEWVKIEEVVVKVDLTKGADTKPRLTFYATKGNPGRPRQFPFTNIEEVSVHWEAEFFLDNDSSKVQVGDRGLSDPADGITIRPSFARAK